MKPTANIDSKSKHQATAVKRLIAAATFEFAIDDEGRLTTGAVSSWDEHGYGDEQAVVSELFDHIRMREGVPVLTYGGLVDIPVLVLASMEHQLTLPLQLTRSARPERTEAALGSRSYAESWRPDLVAAWLRSCFVSACRRH